MRDENKADRVQIVSGRGESETWKEVNAAGLAQPFKTFRSVFAEELTTRFLLDTTPNKHIQLALKMNPAINTEPKGPLLSGKSAMHEMMTAEYKRALRRAALRRAGSSAPAPVPIPAAVDEAEAVRPDVQSVRIPTGAAVETADDQPGRRFYDSV